MKKRKKIRSITAITWLLLLALLVTWLGSMVCTTLVMAQEMYDDLYDFSYSYLNAFSPDRCDWETAEAQNQTTLSYLQWFNQASYYHHSGPQSWWEKPLLNDFIIPEQVAVTVTDVQGDPVVESGDFLTFSYYTQQQWDAHADGQEEGWFGYLKMDRSGAYDAIYDLGEENYFLIDARVLRITGTVKEGLVDPVQIDYISEFEFLKAITSTQSYRTDEYGDTYAIPLNYDQPVSLLEPFFTWTTLLEREVPADGELSVIYAVDPWMTVYDGEPLSYRGEKYENMLELLHRAELSDTMYDNGEYTLSKLVRFERHQLKSAPDATGNRQNLTVTCGYYAQPLKATVAGLWRIYLITGQLTLMVGIYVLSFIRRRLTRPLQDTCDAIALDWYPYASEEKRIWREPDYLQEVIAEEAQHRKTMQDKITRLETALSYAKTAEENRRQMTSNIAHELKTPLAIIHSYTEGLKEHIAEEKRDQYLDTILAETERMDTMVMEMLDLSRLEAGKVTLTRTEFSLSDLAQVIYDAFSGLAQEKQLQVQLTLSDDSTVFADEGRIEQVIRNFLSNAIRYTPEGGTVHIRTESRRSARHHSVVFRVENSGHRFSKEELQKLWDTFYRADPSRSSKGTGLGLAICKNIISLHGGRCEAKNTELGVEFSFVL